MSFLANLARRGREHPAVVRPRVLALFEPGSHGPREEREERLTAPPGEAPPPRRRATVDGTGARVRSRPSASSDQKTAGGALPPRLRSAAAARGATPVSPEAQTQPQPPPPASPAPTPSKSRDPSRSAAGPARAAQPEAPASGSRRPRPSAAPAAGPAGPEATSSVIDDEVRLQVAERAAPSPERASTPDVQPAAAPEDEAQAHVPAGVGHEPPAPPDPSPPGPALLGAGRPVVVRTVATTAPQPPPGAAPPAHAASERGAPRFPPAVRALDVIEAPTAVPAVHVTIGRIEVRASTLAAPRISRPPEPPAMSLEEHLRERAGGSR